MGFWRSGLDCWWNQRWFLRLLDWLNQLESISYFMILQIDLVSSFIHYSISLVSFFLSLHSTSHFLRLLVLLNSFISLKQSQKRISIRFSSYPPYPLSSPLLSSSSSSSSSSSHLLHFTLFLFLYGRFLHSSSRISLFFTIHSRYRFTVSINSRSSSSLLFYSSSLLPFLTNCAS